MRELEAALQQFGEFILKARLDQTWIERGASVISPASRRWPSQPVQTS